MSAAPVHERLIVFTRYPEPGSAKTRLIPALGPAGAAELQHRMTRLTLVVGEALRQSRGVAVEVRFVGGDAAAMASLYGGDFSYVDQGEGDLGDRLNRAVADAFAAGCKAVALIGADCPALTTDILREAFDRLVDHDLVLGPAVDGGYYLAGLVRPLPTLFVTRDVPWGTGSVLRATLSIAASQRLRVALLPQLADVDVPEDLDWFRRAGWHETESVKRET